MNANSKSLAYGIFSIRNAQNLVNKKNNELNLSAAGIQISAAMRRLAPLHDDICIIATGSDGRLEKGWMSPLEPIILCNDKSAKEIEIVKKALEELDMGPKIGLSTVKNIEIKNIDDYSGTFNFAYNNQAAVWPQRVFDGEILYGSDRLAVGATIRVVDEWYYPDKKNYIKDKLASASKEAKKITTSGIQIRKGNAIMHYDLEDGIAYYGTDETTGLDVRSFKHGPLRYMQGKMAEAIMKHSATQSNDRTALIAWQMPKFSPDRLEYLKDEGIMQLSRGEADALKFIYMHFLWHYHLSEYNALKGEARLKFDAALAKTMLNDMASILK